MIQIPKISVKHNWRNARRKSGLFPIHISVYLHGEPVRYYPIKLPAKVAKEDWQGDYNHWVKDTHVFFFEINCKISEVVAKFNELIKRHYNQNKPVTFYAIERELMYRGERNIFNDYFKNFIRFPPETVKLDEVTWEKYTACLQHLNTFQPRITFAEIDETLIARFKNYLANLKGRKGKMDPATIKSYFDKLKVVLTHAAKKEHFLDPIELERHFEEIKISVPQKKEGQHLEIEEIQRLRKLQFDKKDESLERDRDLFLFQVLYRFLLQ